MVFARVPVLVKTLVNDDANVDAEEGFLGIPIHWAASAGHSAFAKLLLEGPANTAAEAGNYGNALQAAAGYGHLEVVNLLLERGADALCRHALLQYEQLGHHESVLTPCPTQRDKSVTYCVVDALDEVCEGGQGALSRHQRLITRLRRLCWTEKRQRRRKLWSKSDSCWARWSGLSSTSAAALVE